MRHGLMVGILLAAVPALADEAPLLKPAKDVAVEYRASGLAGGPMSGGDGVLKMYFANKGSLMRVDPPNGQGYMIIEPDTGRMTVIMPAQRMYMALPSGPGMVPMLDTANATYRKIGTDTVAGTACTTYDASNAERKSEVCLTADGVLLRGWTGEGGSRQNLEAVNISYGPQSAALFEPPAGFTKLDMPGIGGAMFPALGGAAGR